MRGEGGLTPQRPDQATSPPQAWSIGAGSKNIFRGRQVVVFGTGAGTGIFVYAGTPGPGNPPIFWVVAPGVTADPFGNALPAGTVMGAGTPGGASLAVDQLGDVTLTGASGSQISLTPAANLPFSLTSALSGIMQAIGQLVTTDVNETQAGVISGIVLGSGAAAKMGTLVLSPYGTSGMGLLLEAQNDGGTDTASGVLGTVSTQGGVLTFQPVLAVLPGAMLLYGPGATLVVVTKTTPGSGTIPIPAGVSVAKGECWGASGASSTLVLVSGGAGGAEYAAEPALAVTGGGTVAFTVPAAPGTPGGGAGNGAAATLTGSAVTVTANGGKGATGTAGGLPGTGSTNTVHNDGGRGGTGGSFVGSSFGGGGAAAGSSAGPGANGANATSSGPGAGATGVSGAGSGGKGASTAPANAGNGTAPGGAPGGFAFGAAGQPGTHGQVRLTYSTGAPAILASIASAAGTDQFGTAYPSGMRLNETDGNAYRTERLSVSNSSNFPGNSTSPLAITGLQVNVGAGLSYRVTGMINIAQGTVTSGQRIAFSGSCTVTSMRISGRYADTTALTQGNPIEITALAGTPQAQNMTANDVYDFWFDGVINVNAGGTFGPTIQNLTSGDTCTIGANSVMDLMPV